MSNGLNRAQLIGNIGIEPEIKFTQGGQAVLRLRVATNESWLKDGVKQEKTEWHTVVVWGKRAEGLHKILEKGKQLFIEGRIETRSWEDKDGGKRYSTEINASDIKLLGGGGGAQRSGGQRGADTGHDSGIGEPADDDDDQIPF